MLCLTVKLSLLIVITLFNNKSVKYIPCIWWSHVENVFFAISHISICTGSKAYFCVFHEKQIEMKRHLN